jgi:hypothetical protein
MISHILLRRAAAFAAVYALCAVLAAPAHAQAWVPEPGTGTLTLDYQFTHVKNHVFSVDMAAYGGNGPRVDMGKIDGQSGQFNVDYGVLRNLGFSASVAYVAARYRGTDPESMMDDGSFHGTLQDYALDVRYMVPWQGFAITPSLGYAAPTHAYDLHGHVASGRGNSSFNAGVAVARTLAPWVPGAWLQGGYTHEFVKNVQQWGLDVNSYSGTLGFLVLPQLSASGYFTYSAAEDGIDWYWDDFSLPGVEQNHDRAAKFLIRRAGGTLSYQLRASNGVFVDVGGMVSGANTHDGISYTVGTNWNFVGPFAH